MDDFFLDPSGYQDSRNFLPETLVRPFPTCPLHQFSCHGGSPPTVIHRVVALPPRPHGTRLSLASLECLSGEINSTIHRLLTTHHWQLLPQDRYRLETADSDILNQDLATRQLWIVSFEWAKDHFKSAAQQSLRSH